MFSGECKSASQAAIPKNISDIVKKSFSARSLMPQHEQALRQLLEIYSEQNTALIKYSCVLYLTKLLQLAYCDNPRFAEQIIAEYRKPCSQSDADLLAVIGDVAKMHAGVSDDARQPPEITIDKLLVDLQRLTATHPYADFIRAVLLVEKNAYQAAADIYLGIINTALNDSDELQKSRQALAYFNLAALLYRDVEIELPIRSHPVIYNLVEQAKIECEQRLNFFELGRIFSCFDQDFLFDHFFFQSDYESLQEDAPVAEATLKKLLICGLNKTKDCADIKQSIITKMADNSEKSLRDIPFSHEECVAISNAWQFYRLNAPVVVFFPSINGVLVRHLLETSIKLGSIEGAQLLASLQSSRDGFLPGGIVRDPSRAVDLATKARAQMPLALREMGPGSAFERLGPVKVDAVQKLLDKLTELEKRLPRVAFTFDQEDFEALQKFVRKTVKNCFNEDGLVDHVITIESAVTKDEMNFNNATIFILNAIAAILNPPTIIEGDKKIKELKIKTREYLRNVTIMDAKQEIVLQQQTKCAIQQYIGQNAIDKAIFYGHSGAMLYKARKLLAMDSPDEVIKQEACSLLYQAIWLGNPDALYYCLRISINSGQYPGILSASWGNEQLKEIMDYLLSKNKRPPASILSAVDIKTRLTEISHQPAADKAARIAKEVARLCVIIQIVYRDTPSIQSVLYSQIACTVTRIMKNSPSLKVLLFASVLQEAACHAKLIDPNQTFSNDIKSVYEANSLPTLLAFIFNRCAAVERLGRGLGFWNDKPTTGDVSRGASGITKPEKKKRILGIIQKFSRVDKMHDDLMDLQRLKFILNVDNNSENHCCEIHLINNPAVKSGFYKFLQESDAEFVSQYWSNQEDIIRIPSESLEQALPRLLSCAKAFDYLIRTMVAINKLKAEYPEIIQSIQYIKGGGCHIVIRAVSDFNRLQEELCSETYRTLFRVTYTSSNNGIQVGRHDVVVLLHVMAKLLKEMALESNTNAERAAGSSQGWQRKTY